MAAFDSESTMTDDDFEAASRSMREMLDRVPTADRMLEHVCDCAKVDRADADGASSSTHLWPCPAGIVEYWFSRHSTAAHEWIARVAISPPPEPGW